MKFNDPNELYKLTNQTIFKLLMKNIIKYPITCKKEMRSEIVELFRKSKNLTD